MLNIETYLQHFQAIAKANNWSHLHTPKNLALAVLQESAELSAEFQWLTEPQSASLAPEHLARVGNEIADVSLYLFALCQALDLNLEELIVKKQALNKARFDLT